MSRVRILPALLGAILVAGCAAGGPAPPGAAKAPRVRAAALAPAADSVTTGLWRFDENGGTHCADAGPFRLAGTAGLDTRTDFGRFKSARFFQRSVQSFAQVPYNPVMESARGFTVEAWLYVNSVSDYELQCVAGRWTPLPNGQSWVFGVSGLRRVYPAVVADSPGWFTAATAGVPPGRLLFVYQPAEAAGAKGYFSTVEVPLQRWTHVAVTVDGTSVKLWLDGRIDSQYATNMTVRSSDSPLLVGNLFDPHRLTDFGGDLRIDATVTSALTFYLLDGGIDELRLSNVARTRFESLDTR